MKIFKITFIILSMPFAILGIYWNIISTGFLVGINISDNWFEEKEKNEKLK